MDARYREWLKRVTDAGRQLVEYGCPSCKAPVHSLRPEPGDTYSTMFSCPHCDSLHFRVVEADGTVLVDGEVLPTVEEKWERNDSVTAVIVSVGGVTVDEAIVETWTDEQCQQAEEWAGAVHLRASDNDDVEVPPMPAFLEGY